MTFPQAQEPLQLLALGHFVPKEELQMAELVPALRVVAAEEFAPASRAVVAVEVEQVMNQSAWAALASALQIEGGQQVAREKEPIPQ